MIFFSNLSKTFSKHQNFTHAVKNVSFTIESGDIFGIIGLSGAGKSTLLRCINGLETPTSGEVIVDSCHLKTLKKRELMTKRQEIGMIFQHFNLLNSRTVFDNIALPLEIKGCTPLEIKERVNELLKWIDLEDKKDAYPNQLSGGQKQRVAIARAIANRPKILLCDEATSALDPKTTESILDILKSINRDFGITIVLITHELDVVRSICNRVAVMKQGEVVKLGSTEDVLQESDWKTCASF